MLPVVQSKKERWLVWSGVFLVFAVMLYRYWAGENSYIRVHDYGEVHLPIFKAMEFGDFFGLKRFFDPFLGGVERNALGSEFNIGNLLHVFLPPLTAVIIVELCIRLTAFVGLYLFLEKTLEIAFPLLSFATAMAFAVLPFYPPLYLTIAGLPIVAWALIRISRQEAVYKEYTICLLFSLFIAFSGLPGIFLFLFLIIVAYWIIEQKFSARVLVVIAGMILVFFLSEWRLIVLNFFDPDFISHRIENTRGYLNPERKDYVLSLFRHMARGIVYDELMHSPTYHLKIMLPFSALVALFSLFDFKVRGVARRLRYWIIMIATIFAVSICIRLTAFLLQPHIALFREFQLERIVWMYPALMYILFAVTAAYLCTRFQNVIIKVVVVGLITYNGINTFLLSNDPQHFQLATYGKMTYADFFAESLFDDIHEYLLEHEVDRVVSVGINPGVAMFNGFRIADGYWNMYDVRYKRRFRQVISEEIAHNRKLKRYFDKWGYRVHMFYNDQPARTWWLPEKQIVSKEFSYRTRALVNLSVSHVFSVFEVSNAGELGWKYEKTFCEQSIPYCILLYSIDHSNLPHPQTAAPIALLLKDD